MKIIINPNKDIVAEVDRQLEENLKEYGHRYCPCSLIHNEDTICMCKEFREQEEGMCHCGKYIKIKVDN